MKTTVNHTGESKGKREVHMSLYRASLALRKHMLRYRHTPDPGQKTTEEELTRMFLRELAVNRRMLSYSFSRKEEAKNGADWIWIFLTEFGMFRFLVQAKYLRKGKTQIERAQVRFKSHSGAFQAQSLLSCAKKIRATAIYVIYTEEKSTFFCRDRELDTEEGVFFDSAVNLVRAAFSGHGSKIPQTRHMPISCLTACYAKHCRYRQKNGKGMCMICRHDGCRYLRRCRGTKGGKRRERASCRMPFQHLIHGLFGDTCTALNLTDDALAVMFAPSVLAQRAELEQQCLSRLAEDARNFVDRVLITDYVNRHGSSYLSALLGRGFEAETQTVRTREEITAAVREAWQDCPFLLRVGLFGSYARGEAGPASDVDLALIYDSGKICGQEDLQALAAFFRKVCLGLKKNVDFVDYAAQTRTDPEFVECIGRDMIWLARE